MYYFHFDIYVFFFQSFVFLIVTFFSFNFEAYQLFECYSRVSLTRRKQDDFLIEITFAEQVTI